MSKRTEATKPVIVRCAIYTRKGTEEGLEQAFNSLDAQRESAEAYIAAQKHEGWHCLPEKYDDSGFTGGNLKRPAMRRLLADIEAGKVDCVVVYKVDRLSRSLLDFARAMQVFEKHSVTFVSVTQQFNTTHSMGRLTLNILLSFAQFEREIISERTRDKIAAARRKGKWSGGKPLLGYDIQSSPSGSRLLVNDDEAQQVRAIFELYARHQALIPTVTELNQRGWVNKRWLTKDGRAVGGRAFDKTGLYHLLTNLTYTGIVSYQGQTYPGEHQAIVEPSLFAKVQAILSRNGRQGGAQVRNRHGALLKGLLQCASCNCAMVHSYTSRRTCGKAAKRYRYYVCLQAQKKGWKTCPTKSVPASEIEHFVQQQISHIGQDPAVLTSTLRQMRHQQEKDLASLQASKRLAERAVDRHRAALARSTADPADLALQAQHLQQSQVKVDSIHQQIQQAKDQEIDASAVSSALSAFGPVWEKLDAKEQARVIALLVQQVVYDGANGTLSITFRPGGIKTLAREQGHEAAA